MKFLALCNGGICRSVAMAGVLKYEHGKDALAASLDKNTEETLDFLMNWADRIVVMEEGLLVRILKPEHVAKTTLANVGFDRWENPMDADLLRIVNDKVSRWAFRGFTAGGQI